MKAARLIAGEARVVDVETSGPYAFGVMCASHGEGSFKVFADGVLRGTVTVPTAHADADPVVWRRWQHWYKVAAALTLNLQQRTHLVHLEVVVGYVNLDYLEFRQE